LIFAYIINVSGNKIIGKTSQFMAFVKIAAIIVFAMGGLRVAHFNLGDLLPTTGNKDN